MDNKEKKRKENEKSVVTVYLDTATKVHLDEIIEHYKKDATFPVSRSKIVAKIIQDYYKKIFIPEINL